MKLFPSLSNNINQEIMTLVRHAMRNTAKIAAGKVATRHEAKDGHIFIFFSPRSGSTWLTEAFTAQPHMRSLEDPFNWRNAFPYHMRHLPRPSGYFFSEQDMTPEVQDFIADLAEGRKHAGADWRYWLSHFREPTHRATFKFCNMTWALDSLTESFKARSILLLRHPATVAISQKNWGRRPALEAYRQHLTRIYDAPAQECLARLQACPQADDPITVSVTEWCIENWPHISGRLNCSHYVIHYEHLVTRTAEETESIAAFTGGLDMEAFIRSLSKPSKTVSAQLDSRTALASAEAKLAGWMDKLDAPTRARCGEILQTFGVTSYSFDDPMPATPSGQRRP